MRAKRCDNYSGPMEFGASRASIRSTGEPCTPSDAPWGSGWPRATQRPASSSDRTRASRAPGSARSWRRAWKRRDVQVVSAGVITTPGIAYLTRANHFSAGIVISASHNPWQDNGIKIFGADGYKLSDQLEHEIEADIFAHLEQLAAGASDAVVSASDMLPGEQKLREQYAEWLADLVCATDFSRLRVLVDCANGAASTIAPLVFRDVRYQSPTSCTSSRMGATSTPVAERCIPRTWRKAVAAANGKYDLGITFDGDADRAMFSDASGRVVNGDGVLLLAARDMKTHVRLHNDTVVATTMSNMGLEAALKRSGIRMLRAPVGDKYVLEEMLKTGATLGGEQSGHILFRDMDTTTGDGILTALRVLEVMARTGQAAGRTGRRHEGLPAGNQERSRAREAAAGATARSDGCHSRRRARTRRQRPRGGSLLGHREAGAGDDRSGIGRGDAPPHRRHRQRDPAGDRGVIHHRRTQRHRDTMR